MRKPRRILSPDEQSLLLHLIAEHLRTSTSELMALFNVSRDTIQKYKHRYKLQVAQHKPAANLFHVQPTDGKIQP